MKKRKLQIFLTLIYFSFLITVLCFSGMYLYKFLNLYFALQEARKTSVVKMQKISIPDKSSISFACTINMSQAKWIYHHGVPNIAIDGKDTPLREILKNSHIIFKLDAEDASPKTLDLSYKKIRDSYKWEQERLNMSPFSGFFRAFISKKDGRSISVSYQQGLNKIHILIAPIKKVYTKKLSAFVFFRENCEMALPFIPLTKGIVLGIFGMMCLILFKVKINNRSRV